MRIEVLGPTRVLTVDGRPVPLERKAREVLALLALEAPRPLSLDALIELLWDDPPPAAAKVVQSHLSRIRAALRTAGFGEGGLERQGHGHYALVVPASALDVAQVGELRAAAKARCEAGDDDGAAALLAEALGSWSGRPELPPTVGAAASAARWERERADIELEHLQATAFGSEPGTAIATLEGRLATAPGDELAWALLVTALRRAGRRVDALRTYQRARAALADLGLDPGPTLRAAEAEALAGDGEPSPDEALVRYTAELAGSVAYTVLGEAPTDLLLLNPGVLSIDGLLDEPHLRGAVAGLRRSARVVSLDRRGVGLSDPLPDDQPPLDAWVDDASAVLQGAGAGPAVVLASSDAGLIAIQLAARHPRLVRGLVLVHAYARYRRSTDYPFGVDPATAAAISADALSVVPTEVPGFDPLSSIAPSVSGDPAFRRWWDAAGRRAASPATAALLHSAVQEADVRHLLPRVNAPTLVLHRRSCTSCDPGHARFLVEHLPNAQLRWLDGADELWFTAGAAELLEAVEGFVAELLAVPYR